MIRKNNLVAYWKLNGATDSSGNVLDFSGNEHSGSIKGTEAYNKNNNDKKIQYFSGADQVTLPNSDELLTNNNFTIVTKCNPTSLTTVTDTDNRIITLYKASIGSSTVILFVEDGTYQYLYSDVTGVFRDTGVTATLNKEVIFAVTYDGTTWKAYIDGKLVDTFVGGFDGFGAYGTTVGGYKETDRYFNGTIGDIRIYDIDLTTTEIEQLQQELNTPEEFSPNITPSLTSDGVNDAIDTGIKSTVNTRVEVKGKLFDFSATQAIFGVRTVSDKDDFMLYSNVSSGILNVQYGNSSVTSGGAMDFLVHTVALSKDGVENNGVLTPITYTVMDDNTNNIYLYCFSSSGGAGTSFAHYEMYYAKIWESDVLVRHFLPLSDGTMIDIVNNKIYSNKGAGDLVYKQDALNTTDDTLVFSTRDGTKDLTGKNDITNTDTITGKGMVFNGSTSKLDMGDIGNVRTINLVIDPETTTEEILQLDTGKNIKISSGTITYTGITATTYVNGVASTTLAADRKSHVAIVLSQDEDANNFELGWDGTNYGDIKLDYLKCYNEIKSAEFAKLEYKKEARFW